MTPGKDYLWSVVEGHPVPHEEVPPAQEGVSPWTATWVPCTRPTDATLLHGLLAHLLEFPVYLGGGCDGGPRHVESSHIGVLAQDLLDEVARGEVAFAAHELELALDHLLVDHVLYWWGEEGGKG